MQIKHFETIDLSYTYLSNPSNAKNTYFWLFSPTKYFLFNVKVQLLKLIKIFLLLKRLYDPKQVPPLAILIVRS